MAWKRLMSVHVFLSAHFAGADGSKQLFNEKEI
jgi:hypothetical protein